MGLHGCPWYPDRLPRIIGFTWRGCMQAVETMRNGFHPFSLHY